MFTRADLQGRVCSLLLHRCGRTSYAREISMLFHMELNVNTKSMFHNISFQSRDQLGSGCNMWMSGVEQILMAYLAVIALDKDWEGKTGHEEAVLCQNLAHPFIKAHAMPCKLLSKRAWSCKESGISRLGMYSCLCTECTGCIFISMTEGESMLKVR